jgi:hypothetical protein
MARVMLPFPLVGSPTDKLDMLLPRGSVIKFLSPHGSMANLYVECDPQEELVLWRFHMIPNGFEIPQNATWIGSLSMYRGGTVAMHFYAEEPDPEYDVQEQIARIEQAGKNVKALIDATRRSA